MNWTKHRGKFVWTSGRYTVRRVTSAYGHFTHGFEALRDGQRLNRSCYGFASEARQACERDEAVSVRKGEGGGEIVLR